MTQFVFATVLGQVARSRAALPGHRSPEPTAFVGDELIAWREAFGGDHERTSGAARVRNETPASVIHARCVSAFEAGQRCARETSRVIENPWRAGTPYRAAWQQGFDGKELAPCLNLLEKTNLTTDSFTAGAERSAPTKSYSATADLKPVAEELGISTANAAVTSACATGTAEPIVMGAKIASPTTTRDSRPASTKIETMTSDQTTATMSPVDLVAIDFLNLLVRCFHVGQPSDVHGVRGLLTTVAKIIRTLKPKRVVFAADGGHDHRTALLPTYKAHRPPKPQELVSQIELAETAIAAIGWPLIRVVGFEADDVLASIVREGESPAEPVLGAAARREPRPPIVIVSTDKDLLQLLPRCRVWNPFGEAGGWQTADSVRAKFGCELHQLSDWLALVGDSSDGIPGAAGIGEKTATKLLAEHGDIETAVAQAALGKIPGALGNKLKSAECWLQIEQARKLLALVDTLDVDESLCHSNLSGHGVTGLRDGWQSRLQALRLFGAIKPLSEAFESLSGERSPDPLTSTGSSPVLTATRPPRTVAKSLF